MLCIKAEVAGHDMYGSTSSHGVILPMASLGSSIRRYLKNAKRGFGLSTQSSSSGDGSASSSGLEDVNNNDGAKGEKSGGKMCLYRLQLEQDVQKLQKQLQEEMDLNVALENAVGHGTKPLSNSPSQLPDKAQQLLANITELEMVVSKLEEELVALYFQLSREKNGCRLSASLSLSQSQSSPCYFPAYSRDLISGPYKGGQEEATTNFPLLPQNRTTMVNKDSLMKNLWKHPNKISEEMVRCMRDIFLHLADSSTISYKFSSLESAPSPVSPHGQFSFSSLASFSDSSILPPFTPSPADELRQSGDVMATENTFDPYRFHEKVNWENIGSYSSATEVSCLSIGKKQLEYASEALKRFRLLVEQLAKVNPCRMGCNERLAFWINLYNALIMHAYLAYGIPKSDIKLFFLMQKVAYTVGEYSFSAADIEYIILKMKPPAHRPQIALVMAFHKFKISEEQRKYSIDKPEPLVAFALSCGMYSSPAVRIFTAANVNMELCDSLRDYIRASVGMSNKGKLLVPKLVHCVMKGIIDNSALPDWICRFLSSEQAAKVRDSTSQRKQRLLVGARSFSVIPFDSRFRYLFLPESERSQTCSSRESNGSDNLFRRGEESSKQY